MAVLTLEAADTMIETALAKGRETNCAALTVVVLDAGGHLKAFKRQDGAGILRPDLATGKAWGALGMGIGSRSLAGIAAERPQFATALAALAGGKVVPAPGGVLIRGADGEIIGAVGITGDVSDKDEACAIAGIEAAGFTADPGS